MVLTFWVFLLFLFANLPKVTNSNRYVGITSELLQLLAPSFISAFPKWPNLDFIPHEGYILPSPNNHSLKT